jgi:hypothetical protein
MKTNVVMGLGQRYNNKEEGFRGDTSSVVWPKNYFINIKKLFQSSCEKSPWKLLELDKNASLRCPFVMLVMTLWSVKGGISQL